MASCSALCAAARVVRGQELEGGSGERRLLAPTEGAAMMVSWRGRASGSGRAAAAGLGGMSTENMTACSSRETTSRGCRAVEEPGARRILMQVLGWVTQTGLTEEITVSVRSPGVSGEAYSSACCLDTVCGQLMPTLERPITRRVPAGSAI